MKYKTFPYMVVKLGGRFIAQANPEGIFEVDESSVFFSYVDAYYERAEAENDLDNVDEPIPESTVYFCKKCGFTASDKVSLMLHYRKEHPKQG